MHLWLESLDARREAERTIHLTVISGPHQGRQFTIDRRETFLLGRSTVAHCSLPDDEYLSRNHFMIEVNPPVCRLVDLSSHNGTKVNGERVEVVDLKDGDRIEVGATCLLVAIA
jgi:serine/threonine-protein kinase